MNEFKTCEGCQSPDICKRGSGCGKEMSKQLDTLQRLAAFGAAVLRAGRIPEPADVDGGTLQELGEKAGVLVRRQVQEACGDDCACAGNTTFPTDCFYVPDDVWVLINKNED